MSSEFAYPTVAVSLDGKRALGVLGISNEAHSVRNRDAFAIDALVRLQPLAKPVNAEIIVTGSFEASWNHPMQSLGWDLSLKEALPGLALIELGEFLDGNPTPVEPTVDSKGISVLVSSNSFSVFERGPATEDEVFDFLQSHTFWSWRHKVSPARFTRAEAARLGVSLDDLMHLALRGQDELWKQEGPHELRALPQLVRRLEAVAIRPRSVSSESAEATRGSDWTYEVALSFAGEQREYVREVARRLSDAEVRVFYDEFSEVELWGTDLGSALGEIYEHRSRYVVVFISEEYLTKAWPQHEREHAISGRIARRDDGVLPVRFDNLDLPGLPGTVGYLDARDLSPEDLVVRILKKLGRG